MQSRRKQALQKIGGEHARGQLYANMELDGFSMPVIIKRQKNNEPRHGNVYIACPDHYFQEQLCIFIIILGPLCLCFKVIKMY